MGLHTARLIFTIIFLILALSGLVTGYWYQALFWALIALAVGYPFVRNGRIDLYYDDSPARILVFAPVAVTPAPTAYAAPKPAEVPATGPMNVPGSEAAPPMLQQLFQGNV